MARVTSKSGAKVAPSTTKTAEEMKQWYDRNSSIENFDAAMDAVKQLRLLDKTSYRSITSLNKDSVVQYIQSPASNEKNLRNVTWYLFYRSQVFQRIIMYFASLFCMEARTIIPEYSLTKTISDNSILKSYNDTLSMLDNWNIENEFLKVRIKCLLQDVSYNVAYYDNTGLFLLPLDPDYCRIYGQYPQGDFAFALDMTYFRGTNEWLVEAWGEPFTSMWKEYDGKTANRWQLVPEEYSACFKYRSYDWKTILSPFSGLFLHLINLEDIADVQAIADIQEIYKLVWMELETITGTKIPDDWKVDPQTAIAYMNRLISEALPDYTTAAVVPGKLNVVDFSNNDKTSETNKVLKTTEAVLNTSGGAQILNSAKISGTTAFNAAIKSDTEFAISTLLPQFEGWFNRIMPYVVSNPSTIKFFHVSRLTKDDFQERLLKQGQNGLPVKLAIMTMNGISELQALSLNHLEEDILKLSERFNKPLSTSYTQSDGGAPTKTDTEISDDGEASRDKVDRSNG